MGRRGRERALAQQRRRRRRAGGGGATNGNATGAETSPFFSTSGSGGEKKGHFWGERIKLESASGESNLEEESLPLSAFGARKLLLFLAVVKRV